MKELIHDASFLKGFDLLEPNTNSNRALSGVLDYNGEAQGKTRDWQMSQWWNPKDWDFINSEFIKEGEGLYTYVNISRRVFVDQPRNAITLELDSGVEYKHLYGRPRYEGENWSHVLLEQNFKEPQRVGELNKIIVSLDFMLNFDLNVKPGQKIPCSQATWYFTFTNPKNGDPHYESQKLTNPNDFFWFGLPIYDSRYRHLMGYKHVDSGFVGATNKLIYCIPSRKYLKRRILPGRPYHIEINILPFVEKAFKYGKHHGALEGTEWENVVFNYTNLGWEMPGSFKSSITFSNISIKVERKDSNL